ncbi:MAG: hypothetical protein ACE5K0_04450 [Candidatus Methanofastidiosia archaeon]
MDKEFDIKVNRKRYDLFLSNLKKYWSEDKEAKSIQLISKYSGLNWKCDKILVYFVNNLNISGFSDPLTIKINDDYIGTCETLIHETIHVILAQNNDQVKPVIEHLNQIFPEEDRKTILHIIINSIDRKVFLKVYGEDQFKIVFAKVRKYRGLKRAYEILEDLYPKLNENILRSLLKI